MHKILEIVIYDGKPDIFSLHRITESSNSITLFIHFLQNKLLGSNSKGILLKERRKERDDRVETRKQRRSVLSDYLVSQGSRIFSLANRLLGRKQDLSHPANVPPKRAVFG